MSPIIPSKDGVFRFGVIGDLHTYWDTVDLLQFAATDYDLLFFTGDLGGGTQDSSLRMARLMARLARPSLVMPGNNDTSDIARLAAELTHQRGLDQLLSLTDDLAGDSHGISLCGYSEHRIRAGTRVVSLISGRPHSMGGPALSFPEFMAETYSISSLDDSAARLCELVDAAEEEIIFLSHNGPHGLGDREHDMWGCDFREGGGDWGDPDLAHAIRHARSTGRRVLAVIAGHMHLRTKQGRERPWQVMEDDTLYINAARVPRIFAGEGDVFRHHVRMVISEDDLVVEEVLVAESGG